LDRLFLRLYDLFAEHTLAEDARAASILTRIWTELIVARLETGSPLGSPEAGPAYPAAVRNGIAFLQHNFHRPLKLEEIARQGQLSPFHFARVFKRATGCSVMEYLMRLRMEQAKHLLAETELPVREVAEKVGMPDQSYFSKLFKRHVQKTPTEFRESSRRSGSG
ncbi:MAG: AraC family transcriptional regulator, partial [Alicyclobacillus sp.]|nr:AraC family transcriptional regulator [Alicyclobacillus sp.]